MTTTSKRKNSKGPVAAESDKKMQRQTSLLSFFGKRSKNEATLVQDPITTKARDSEPEKRGNARKMKLETTETSKMATAKMMPSKSENPKSFKTFIFSPQLDNNSSIQDTSSKRQKISPLDTGKHQEETKTVTEKETRQNECKTLEIEGGKQKSSKDVREETSDQEEEEEENENGISSSSDEEEDQGLSDYELLRMRNIQRNNARLASLGLLNDLLGESSNNTMSKKKKTRRPTKKPSKITKPSIPTRRSTRNRKSPLETTTNTIDVTKDELIRQNEEEEEEEEEEKFTISPLLQYSMHDTGTTCSDENGHSHQSSINDTVGHGVGTTSLSPVGPRLIPPKGLKAIYSLDFSPSFTSPNDDTNIMKQTWLVGAGKAGIVAVWDCQYWSNKVRSKSKQESLFENDPVLSWKAHSGRWIAEARFLPNSMTDRQSSHPSNLVTAANDGTVCLWDLAQVSVTSGAPKLLSQTGKELHTGGIFAMDISPRSKSVLIATGSKDKTIALSELKETACFQTFWNSEFHTAKVAAVKLQGKHSTILASASDDGLVAIHDYKCGERNGLIAELDNAHDRPHSVVWHPSQETTLMTAGLDKVIKIWDIRSNKNPVATYQGHVPDNTMRCKRIHHPAFFNHNNKTFILTGGEKSHSLSMYEHNNNVGESREGEGNNSSNDVKESSFYSRGRLPDDCGDAGCIAVYEENVAISVEDGEILILSP